MLEIGLVLILQTSEKIIWKLLDEWAEFWRRASDVRQNGGWVLRCGWQAWIKRAEKNRAYLDVIQFARELIAPGILNADWSRPFKIDPNRATHADLEVNPKMLN